MIHLNDSIKQRLYKILSYVSVAIILICVVINIIFHPPGGDAVLILLKSAFTLIFLVFAWLDLNVTKLYHKILLTLPIPFLWTDLFLPVRISYLIALFISLALIIISAIKLVKGKPIKNTLPTAMFWFFPLSMSLSSYIKLLNEKPIWIIAFIAGIVTTAIIACFLFARKRNKGENSKAPRVIILVLILIGSIYFSFVTVNDLNCLLDMSEADYIEGVIEDKSFSNTRRNSTCYLKIYFNDQTVTLTVSDSEYHFYSVGDKYPIRKHKGAFGMPYYISGNIGLDDKNTPTEIDPDT